MRHQISTLIPRKANVCIFCASRSPSETVAGNLVRSTRRSYHPSNRRWAASSAAAAAPRYDDDDDDDDSFSMLKNSAAKHAPPVKLSNTQPVKLKPKDLPPAKSNITRFFARDRDSPSEAQRNVPQSAHRENQRGRNPDFPSQRGSRDRSWRDQREPPSRPNVRRLDLKDLDLNTEQLGAKQEFTGVRFPGRSRYNRPDDGASLARSSQKSVDARVFIPRQPVTEVEEGVETYKPAYVSEEPTRPRHKSEPVKPVVSTIQDVPKPSEEVSARASETPETPPSIPDDAPEETSNREAEIELPTTNTPSFKFSSRFGTDEDETDQPSRQRQTIKRNRTADFDFELHEAEQALSGRRGRKNRERKQKVEATKPVINIPEFMTVQQLAQALKIKQDDLIRKLEEEGFEGARYDHMLDAETSAMFADIYGFEPVALEEEMQDLVSRPPPEDVSELPERPPIVTIMGHVDHGKTTILDWLRKSSVAAGEHGGITQHIGAFSVVMPGTERRITFLDTPGHEAFLDMRRRGANVTDIVVLVVAADDSVKPQTVEAIKHALEARVQIIVAINKVDKHDANIEQVKQDLTRHEIVVEDYGGDFQAIPVSGKTGQGMEQLEEAIITLADVLDLRAEQDIPAEGQIIESKVTNAGRVATILVRRGVLRIGDFIVAGPTWGRVRTLRNDAGQLVQAAYPGDPVQVDGWRGSDPTAGLEVLQAENEQQAKDVVELRQEKIRSAQSLGEIAGLNAAKAKEAEARAKVLEWERENQINTRRRTDNEGWVDADDSSGPKEVFFVVKADVAGSVEAIVAAVSAIGNNEIRATVVHSGTGPVTESDIRLLAISGENSYAISFNQPIEPAMHSLAEAAGVQIMDHNIIYKVTDAVKEKVSAALPSIITQRVLGEAEIGQIFEITVKKQKIKIAGSKVTNGTISRSNKVRVIRNGETIYTGTIDSLKNVKKDVTEMRKGTECGIGFSEWDDAQAGDQIQCFEEKEEKRTLY